MTTEIKPEEKKTEVVTPATEEKKPDGTAKETPPATPSQESPIKKELDKVKKPKTEAEKAAYALKMNAQRVKELGLDPNAILSDSGERKSSVEEDEDDDAPITKKDLKEIRRTEDRKTALSMVESQIEDADERELTIHHLENTIKPSGDPTTDFNNARALTNAAKNKAVIEDSQRRNNPNPAAGGGSQPKKETKTEELTEYEQKFTKAPWNMTKDEIIKARPNR